MTRAIVRALGGEVEEEASLPSGPSDHLQKLAESARNEDGEIDLERIRRKPARAKRG